MLARTRAGGGIKVPAMAAPLSEEQVIGPSMVAATERVTHTHTHTLPFSSRSSAPASPLPLPDLIKVNV